MSDESEDVLTEFLPIPGGSGPADLDGFRSTQFARYRSADYARYGHEAAPVQYKLRVRYDDGVDALECEYIIDPHILRQARFDPWIETERAGRRAIRAALAQRGRAPRA